MWESAGAREQMLVRGLDLTGLTRIHVRPAAAPIFIFPCGTQECWQQD